MSEHALTRRGFLAGAAGATMLLGASGLASCAPGTPQPAGDARVAHTLCHGCPNRCGYAAYVVGGTLTKLIADDHPRARGRLCADGYGYAMIGESDNRIEQPMRTTANGAFEPISWDAAYAEIAEKLARIMDASGPGSVAFAHGSSPIGAHCAKTLAGALDCPNVYDVDAAAILSRRSGAVQVIGTTWEADLANADAALIVGSGSDCNPSPALVQAVAKARANGANVFVASPKWTTLAKLASEWVALKPGTEMALVLACSNALVSNGRYDKELVAAQVDGFAEWRDYIVQCTPDWAEGICGVPTDAIARIADALSSAAPASSVSFASYGVTSCFANTGETARAAAVLNTLLGCWNRQGGALLRQSAAPKEQDQRATREGAMAKDDYALAAEPTIATLLDGIAAGEVKSLVLHEPRFADCGVNRAHLGEALGQLDLCVVIDSVMSDAAKQADYLLPEPTFLERSDLPAFVDAPVPAIALQDQVLEPAFDGLRAPERIFRELAGALGTGDEVDFDVEELADEQLEPFGLTLAGMRKIGTASLPEYGVKAGELPEKWHTPTGKIQFASDACGDVLFARVPEWREPDGHYGADTLRLVSGPLPACANSTTAQAAPVESIARDYGLNQAVMSTQDAASLDISEAGVVELSNSAHTARFRVAASNLVQPGFVWLPTGFGAEEENDASSFDDFAGFEVEPGYGGLCAGTVVSARKVGD